MVCLRLFLELWVLPVHKSQSVITQFCSLVVSWNMLELLGSQDEKRPDVINLGSGKLWSSVDIWIYVIFFSLKVPWKKLWVCSWLVRLTFWLELTKAQRILSLTSIFTGGTFTTHQSFRPYFRDVRTASITSATSGTAQFFPTRSPWWCLIYSEPVLLLKFCNFHLWTLDLAYEQFPYQLQLVRGCCYRNMNMICSDLFSLDFIVHQRQPRIPPFVCWGEWSQEGLHYNTDGGQLVCCCPVSTNNHITFSSNQWS